MDDETVNFDPLLEPIGDDAPAGVDPRGDDPGTPFQLCKQARTAASLTEKSADEGMTGRSAEELLAWLHRSRSDWSEVDAAARRSLRDEAKDSETATYLTEAAFRLEGFAGLAAGAAYLHDLLERYWDHVFPREDEEDGGGPDLRRVAFLGGGDMLDKIRRYPLTGDASTIGPFGLFQYEEGRRLEGLDPEKREKEVERGTTTGEQFAQAVRETDTRELRRTATSLRQAASAFEELDDFLEDRDVYNAPFFRRVRDALAEAHAAIEATAGDRLSDTVADDPDEETTGDADGPGPAGVAAPAGAMTRESAFEQIEKIAEFFERTEPQSLLPSALRKAVRRGRLSPAQFFWEALGSGDRDTLFREYDLTPPAGEDEY